MELEKGHLQYLIEHVFLPPKLPQSYDAETEHKDESLHRFVAEASQRFVEILERSHGTSQRDLQQWRQVDKMLQRITVVHQLHRLTKEDIESVLQQMNVGGKPSQISDCDHADTKLQSHVSPSYCRPECGRNFPQGGS